MPERTDIMFILSDFAVEGRFADGYEQIIGGRCEQECVEELANMQDEHGELVWYSSVADEHYFEGIPRCDMKVEV